MAGEIGHVVYAARVLTYLGDRVRDPLYWVGTLFPDIKHLGVVSRHRTHPAAVTLQTLVGKSDFDTGMRVHSWIDATREQFLSRAHIKETLPWHPFVPHALKLLEDELLYDHFDDWNLIHRLLNQTYPPEAYYVQSRKFLLDWHTVVQRYVARRPTDVTRQALGEAIGLSAASAAEVNTVVARLRHDGRAQQVLTRFWQHLETLLR